MKTFLTTFGLLAFLTVAGVNIAHAQDDADTDKPKDQTKTCCCEC